jgi:hypothetical protein
VHPYHERLARLGLEAAAQYGFALAGGYAIQAAGFLERPSEDVDLFTARENLRQFPTAVAAIVDAYVQAGLAVDNDLQNDEYARLFVTDPSSGETSKVDLVVDFRHERPIQMSIGPVTHPDDLMAAKMGALYTRAEPRDFLDIDAALRSGRYDRDQLIRLFDEHERGFDRQMFAGALGQAARISDAVFAQYGASGRQVEEMRERFAEWRNELLT